MLERLWREGNPPTLLVGKEIGAATVESSVEASLKTEKRITMRSCNPTPGHVSGKDKNSTLKRYMHPNVHCSTIYNSQDVEAI